MSNLDNMPDCEGMNPYEFGYHEPPEPRRKLKEPRRKLKDSDLMWIVIVAVALAIVLLATLSVRVRWGEG